jgi:hypothetical protein
MEHMMRTQTAAVYRLGDFYLVHSLMRVPSGYWVARPPFARVGVEGAPLEQLGEEVKAALDKSDQLPADPPRDEPQDAELIKAAGFKSRKRFVEAATTCTVERTGEVVEIRGAVRAAKGSYWVPDSDAVEVAEPESSALGEVVEAMLVT